MDLGVNDTGVPCSPRYTVYVRARESIVLDLEKEEKELREC